MNETDILKALQKAVEPAVASSAEPTLPIKYLLRTFNIPDNHKYLEIVHVPNNITGEFWGEERTYRGIFRLVLHWPVDDAGAYPPSALLDQIAGYFEKGRVFNLGATNVQIYEHPQASGPVEAGEETLFVVSIWYMSFQP